MAAIKSNKGTCEPVARNSVTANPIPIFWQPLYTDQVGADGTPHTTINIWVSPLVAVGKEEEWSRRKKKTGEEDGRVQPSPEIGMMRLVVARQGRKP
jgi:hypothetical protein